MLARTNIRISGIRKMCIFVMLLGKEVFIGFQ